MSRSTEVGRGYVGLEINGDGMNEDIVDEVNRAGPGVERAGEEHGDRYGDGFQGGFFARLRSRFQKGIAEELHSRAAADGRTTGDQMGSAVVARIRAQLAGANDLFDKYLSDLGNGETKTPRRIKSITDGIRASRLAVVALDTQLRRTLTEGPSTARSPAIDNLRAKLEDVNNIVVKYIEDIANHDGKSFKRLDALHKGLDASRLAAVELEKQLARTLAAETASNRVSGNGRNKDTLGDKVGTIFGAGSRNNFLNIFGKGIGGSVDLVRNLTKGIKPLFNAFTKGFAEAGEGANFLQKSLSGLSEVGLTAGEGIGKGLASLAASGPAGAAAIAAIVVAMAALVSIAGAALAILTALSATIASGLVGALAIVGPAIAGLIVSVGLLVAAFKSMDDAQKKLLKNSFAPIKAEFVGLGQAVFKGFTEKIYEGNSAIQVWSANIQKAIALAGPLASVMGRAFAEAGNSLTASFSGPGFKRFTDALTVYLPGITTRLSAALGSFLNGLLGTFSAILPYVLRFSDYLARTADTFSRFANSTQGQNAISDFVGRALTSLTSLFNFTKQVGGLIADILFNPQSQAAGNSIFDSAAAAVERMRQRFAGAAADGSLKRFFDDAIQFGGRFIDTISAISGVVQSLYNSGMLQALGTVLDFLTNAFKGMQEVLGPLMQVLGFALPKTLALAFLPLQTLVALVFSVIEGIKGAIDLINKVKPGKDIGGGGADWGKAAEQWKNVAKLAGQAVGYSNQAVAVSQNGANLAKSLTFGDDRGNAARAPRPSTTPFSLINSGRNALANTTPKQYVNPYAKYAESLMKQGPSQVQQIRTALKALVKQVTAAITEVAKSSDFMAARATLLQQANDLISGGQQAVDNARSALNSAASSLASASSAKAAKKALAEVRAAQAALSVALTNQKRLNAQAKILKAQRNVTNSIVAKLLDGKQPYNATLADYAKAREQLAKKIATANQKLADAISLRDQYKTQVTDAIKTFGDITSAQAQSIGGVEQALTATDVTANLQDRLDKIRKFNENLRILLAQGLSNDAYKQILDAGVEGGSGTAAALVAGGAGVIQQVNSLTQQIGDAATGMGNAASQQLYQAGVSAAQGMVDGLKSLSHQLDTAAAELGKSVANAIRKALGIKSPSTVLRQMMGYVGDGAVLGLDDQASKIDSAATRFASRIAVSPEIAAYAAQQSQGQPVSGNGDQRPIDLTIITPTEDPHAVAMETINELVGRIG